MQHSFDIDIAKDYGIVEAILLNNFEFWLEKNKANQTNFYDGYYWTYNSVKAFNELFPYLSPRKIQNALKHLRDENILQVGNYNKLKYDRTLWYAFTKKGECIMQKCKMDNDEMLNGNLQNVEPIPNIKSNNKISYIKTDIYNKEFDELWELYPRKVSKAKALQSYIKARKNGVEYEIIKKGVENYSRYVENNRIEQEYIKHGSTWFNQECWNDEYGGVKYAQGHNYEFGGSSGVDYSLKGRNYDLEELMKIK